MAITPTPPTAERVTETTPVPPPLPSQPPVAAPGVGLTAWFQPSVRGFTIALIGGAAALIGSFMPWVKVTAIFVGTISVSGADGDAGKFTAALGGGIAVIAALALAKDQRRRVLTAALGVASVVLALYWAYKWNDGRAKMGPIKTDGGQAMGMASFGSGFWLVGLASVACIVGSILAFIAPRRSRISGGR